jgi:hypothetical protein
MRDSRRILKTTMLRRLLVGGILFLGPCQSAVTVWAQNPKGVQQPASQTNPEHLFDLVAPNAAPGGATLPPADVGKATPGGDGNTASGATGKAAPADAAKAAPGKAAPADAAEAAPGKAAPGKADLAKAAPADAAKAAAPTPTTSVTIQYTPQRNLMTGVVTVGKGVLKPSNSTVQIKYLVAKNNKLWPPAILVTIVVQYRTITGTYAIATATTPVILDTQNSVYTLDLTKFAANLVDGINNLLAPGFDVSTPLQLDNGGQVEVKVTPVIWINPLANPSVNTGDETSTPTKLTITFEPVFGGP